MPKKAKKAIYYTIPVLFALALAGAFSTRGCDDSDDFRGRVLVYGIPASGGEIDVLEAETGNQVASAAINANGNFQFPRPTSNKRLVLSVRTERPVNTDRLRAELKETIELYPVVKWETVEESFRNGKGDDLVQDAKRTQKAIEFRGNANENLPLIGNRLFLHSADRVVKNINPDNEDNFKLLATECTLDENSQKVLPRDPITVIGIPVSFQNGENNKVLKISNGIIQNK